MDPFDADAARAVWQRVTAGTARSAAPEQDAPEALLALALEGWAAYAALARGCGGQTAATLRALARGERENARLLAALCYARTGERPRLTMPEPDDPGGAPAARFRARYQREMDAAARYTRAAEADALARPLYSRLASLALRRGDTLLRLIAAALGRLNNS